MTTIPSPYNFVPLSERIFFPPWAAQVSMDVPFSDGISGSFDIEVEAMTPIYTRNSGPRGSQSWKEFFQVTESSSPEKLFALNGTTVKGMLRNVIEVASFGKLIQEKDKKLSYRDLQNNGYTCRLTNNTGTEANPVYTPKVKAGWLIEDADGNWTVVPCEFSRVQIGDLEAFAAETGKVVGLHSRQTIGNKYYRWENSGGLPLIIRFTPGPETPHNHDCIGPRGTCTCHSPKRRKLTYSLASSVGTTGTHTGTIVFTGQPAPFNPGDRHKKHMEFIFHSPVTTAAKEISQPVKSGFIQANTDPGKENGSALEAWEYWKDKLRRDSRKVPVFYLANTNGNIEYLGLAMMFRLPYQYGIHDFIGRSNQGHRKSTPLDLAETMFGRVGKDDHSLAGRIAIEPLLVTKYPQPKVLAEKSTILGPPRMSYYPNYLEQKTNPKDGLLSTKAYKTYEDDDSDARIRGWKRFTVPTDNSTPAPPTAAGNAATQFIPLDRGVKFRGTIRVHNLRPQELGALIWALAWGGNEALRHNIGMAKPYGYGSIKVRLVPKKINLRCTNGDTLTDLQPCLEGFLAMMRGEITSWDQSEQIKELLAMADPAKVWPTDLRRYPVLQVRPSKNEFADAKKRAARKVLRRHSEIR